MHPQHIGQISLLRTKGETCACVKVYAWNVLPVWAMAERQSHTPVCVCVYVNVRVECPPVMRVYVYT